MTGSKRYSTPFSNVVVVNDDATQLTVLCGLLGKAGLQPLPFKSAEGALAAMSQDSPPALIITDIYMPGIDGWRFCRLLRSPEYKDFNQTPILVVSATFSGDEPSEITSDLGANAFLSMPVDGQQFLETVQALLHGRKPQALLKVLIVENSQLISKRLLDAFRGQGYLADAALTFRDAQALIGQTVYDAAVLNYHLPDGLGDALLKELQEKSADCVCIMITDDPQPEMALPWMKMGASTYLQQPFETEYLIAQYERARRERTLMRIQNLLELRTQQLHKSETRYSNAMEATSDGLWDWDIPSDESYYSPGYLAMLGYAPGELSGSLDAAMELVHPDDRESVLAANWACIRNESEKIDNEFRMKAKDGSWIWIRGRGKAIRRDANGQALQVIGTHVDISERKRLEAAVESRLVALTRPLDQPEGIEFKDLFDLGTIQHLQDEFSNATGVASIITYPDGKPITRPSNFCRLCSDIIRETEQGQINCFKSDAELGRFRPQGPIIQPCMSGGLWDAGAGISVGGRHIANWLIGQVRDETQTEEKMREYARTIGANESTVVDAFREVPGMSQAQFQHVAQALFTIANQLSTSAYQNIQQARFISDRRHAEEALRESENRYKVFFEQGPDGIVVLNPETGQIIEFNDLACRQLGYTREEFGKLRVADIEVIESPEEALSHIQKIMTTGRDDFETRQRTRQGEIRDVQVIAQVIEAGAHPIYHCIWRDITDRKRIEEALRLSEEKFSTAFRISPDSININRLVDGMYLEINEGFTALTGYTVEDAIGKTSLELDIWENPQDRKRLIKGLQETGQVINLEAPFRCKFGEIKICLMSARVIEINQQMCILSITRDISERKKAEEKLKEQLDELRRWHNITQGREERILQLKGEINRLLVEAGKPPRYASAVEVNLE